MPASKRFSLSEASVVLGLVIKVVQTIGEQIGLKNQFPAFFNNASAVSLLLFGLSLVLWLNSSRKGLEKVEALAQRVEDIKPELDDVDHIARYGRGPVHLRACCGQVVSSTGRPAERRSPKCSSIPTPSLPKTCIR